MDSVLTPSNATEFSITRPVAAAVDLPGDCSPMKRGHSFNEHKSRSKNQANRSKCKNVGIVIGDFTGLFKDELILKLGDRIEILTMDTQVSRNIGWWTGKDEKGKIGIFPADCVKVISLSSSYAIDEPTETQHEYPLELSFDDIKLFEVVGIGGFGKVYRGEYRGEEVAVKVARNTTFDSLKAIKEVLSEAEKFAHLAHQNVCALVGVCLVKDVSLVMEYARGGALSTVLHEKKISLPVDVLLDWATQIAEGMCYLHHEANPSLIHRDLKSSNILLAYEVSPDNVHGNVIKITDFGLAKEIEHTTHMSGAGTYPWMAPEVIKSQDFSKKSDVWSFGVVLWELLTGEKPYAGLNMFVIAYGVGHGSLSLPIPEGCPAFLRELMNACWMRPHPHRPSFEDICMVLHGGSISKAEFLSKSTEEITSLRSSWKEDIKKELDAFKKLEIDLHNREDALHEKMRKMTQQEQNLQEKMAALEKMQEKIHLDLEEVNRKKEKDRREEEARLRVKEERVREERPPRVKPFSLKKLVRFFSKPETKKEGHAHHSSKPRKQMSEGYVPKDQAVTPTVVVDINQLRTVVPSLHKGSPLDSSVESIPHPVLQYDSGINNTSCSDASGHSSASKGPHKRSSSDASDRCSPLPPSPYLMNFSPAPLQKPAKAPPTLHPLAFEFDPLMGQDPLRPAAGTLKPQQSPSPTRGALIPGGHSATCLPGLERIESPSVIARPRPRPRGGSQVEVAQFRSPDGPFRPPRSPTGSIQSLTVYPTFEDTSIPCPSDDGSSISGASLVDQTTSDVEDYFDHGQGAIFCWPLDGKVPI